MGQKTNPNIFRLGVNKPWKTQFFEKKQYELPLYTFKDLEIKSYIERFLETQGILLHDYRQHYSNSTLYLYISYFVSSEFLINKKSKTNKLVLLNKSGQKKFVSGKKFNYDKNLSGTMISQHSFKNTDSRDLYRIRKYLGFNSNMLTKKTLLTTDFKFQHQVQSKGEGVLDNMFKVLSLFTKNKFNIVVNFCCINKDLNFLKRTQKNNFTLLQKFRHSPFLKEGIELMLHVVYNRNSANLLAKFIALQIKKVKRHNFFLAFLKQTLTILSRLELSKVKGIKISVKGRLNGVPRARHKVLTIGDVPVQTINTKLDYAQTTAHNSNGSYGIKVWIIEKD